MTDFDRLVPQFVLHDINGYALTKAIEAGLDILWESFQAGVDAILDPQKMPEWRLDEMAGELGILYDYTAPVESKREWIAQYAQTFQSYGTASGIVNFLRGKFGFVRLEEAEMYDGDPFHFRVFVDDGLTEADTAWANGVIERLKNVRSVLDGIALNVSATITISATGNGYKYYSPLASDNLLCGTYPGSSDPI